MLVLQNMLEKDVPKVTKIENKLYFRPWNEKSFIYACHHYISQLIINDEKMVGYAIFDKVQHESQLLNFSIALEYQNQGIGQRALHKLLQSCYQEWSINIIYLEVNSSNKTAIHLYKKLGFTAMGRRLGYYTTATGREDAITMYHSKDCIIA